MIPCLPWSALERVPGQAGVPALWRRVLGEHFDAFANAFLQRTSEMARSSSSTLRNRSSD